MPIQRTSIPLETPNLFDLLCQKVKGDLCRFGEKYIGDSKACFTVYADEIADNLNQML